mmetsp:Transcript_68977/g.205270  ORF Transcript_68977/g.205270 Transcript_68977/m.205270 type:complete len:597 (+) Transcript_68977:72-1862(+)
MPPKQVFKEQVFCISGRLTTPRKDYEDLICKYGGTVVGSVTAAVTHLVSTEDDVKACTQKVSTARGRKVPIVQEGFVRACIDAKKLLDPAPHLVKGAKRKAAAKGAPKATPAKRARVAEGLVETTDKVSVIAKTGLADEAAVVVQEVTKSFGKASITWDVELVLNDPEKGRDKFYSMQVLASKAGKKKFWCVQNWGRTGMEGAVHVDGPFDNVTDAKVAFRKKYRQKTRNAWGFLEGSFVEVPGKYKLLAKDEKGEAPGKWQYYLHNKVDGKRLGWYDYAEDAAKDMEKYWRQYAASEGLGVRFVQADYFKYEVNFTEMIQTNTTSGTRRVIRRVPAGEKPSPAAPEKIPEKAAPREEKPDESSDEDEDPEDGDEDEDEAAEAEAGDAEAAAAGAEGEEEKAEPAAAGRKPPPGADPAVAEAPAGGRKPPPDEAEAEAEAEAARADAERRREAEAAEEQRRAQEEERKRAEEAAAAQRAAEAAQAAPPPDPSVSHLMELGFTEAQARDALQRNNGSIEQAYNSLMGFDEPVPTPAAPPAQSARGPSQARGAPADAGFDQKMSQLTEMGFSATRSRRALQDANGDVNLAMTMLLSAG